MDHVIVDSAPDVVEELAVGGNVVVRAFDRGVAVEGFPGVPRRHPGMPSPRPLCMRLN